jgi:hypothetical protein
MSGLAVITAGVILALDVLNLDRAVASLPAELAFRASPSALSRCPTFRVRQSSGPAEALPLDARFPPPEGQPHPDHSGGGSPLSSSSNLVRMGSNSVRTLRLGT